MQYQSTTEPGFQIKVNVFQPKTKKMSFHTLPPQRMAILRRQHWQSAALIHLPWLKTLIKKNRPTVTKSTREQKCSAPQHKGLEDAWLSLLPAQGRLQPTFRLKSPRQRWHFCAHLSKSKHFTIKNDVPLTILVLNGQNLKTKVTFAQACSGATTTKPLAGSLIAPLRIIYKRNF